MHVPPCWGGVREDPIKSQEFHLHGAVTSTHI